MVFSRCSNFFFSLSMLYALISSLPGPNSGPNVLRGGEGRGRRAGRVRGAYACNSDAVQFSAACTR